MNNLKETINVGTIANDNTGDKIRLGGQKINTNHTTLFRSVKIIQSLQSSLADFITNEHDTIEEFTTEIGTIIKIQDNYYKQFQNDGNLITDYYLMNQSGSQLKCTIDNFVITSAQVNLEKITFTLRNNIAPNTYIIAIFENDFGGVIDSKLISYLENTREVTLTNNLYFPLKEGFEIGIYYFYISETQIDKIPLTLLNFTNSVNNKDITWTIEIGNSNDYLVNASIFFQLDDGSLEEVILAIDANSTLTYSRTYYNNDYGEHTLTLTGDITGDDTVELTQAPASLVYTDISVQEGIIPFQKTFISTVTNEGGETGLSQTFWRLYPTAGENMEPIDPFIFERESPILSVEGGQSFQIVENELIEDAGWYLIRLYELISEVTIKSAWFQKVLNTISQIVTSFIKINIDFTTQILGLQTTKTLYICEPYPGFVNVPSKPKYLFTINLLNIVGTILTAKYEWDTDGADIYTDNFDLFTSNVPANQYNLSNGYAIYNGYNELTDNIIDSFTKIGNRCTVIFNTTGIAYLNSRIGSIAGIVFVGKYKVGSDSAYSTYIEDIYLGIGLRFTCTYS